MTMAEENKPIAIHYLSRNELRMPEYGRNVQQMVNHALTLENRDERNHCAVTIVNFMSSLYPHLRDVEEYKCKLWDHLAIMSDFKLDVDYPYPVSEQLAEPVKPEPMSNTQSNIRFRHYGTIIQKYIIYAAQMPDSPYKYDLLTVLGNHMKKIYQLNNNETFNDDFIIQDINALSMGRLNLAPGSLRFSNMRPGYDDPRRNNKMQKPQNQKQGKKKNKR